MQYSVSVKEESEERKRKAGEEIMSGRHACEGHRDTRFLGSLANTADMGKSSTCKI